MNKPIHYIYIGGVVGEGGGALHTPTLTHRTPSALTPIQIQRMEAESGNEQMMQLIPDQSYLQDRADQMSQVEENIVELGRLHIFIYLCG